MRKVMVFCFASMFATSSSFSATKPSTTPLALAEGDRQIADGRAVLIEVPQSEIDIEVDIGRTVSDTVYGGGLLGALILASKDHKREALTALDTERAKSDVVPLLSAMKDFDFDTLATETTKSGLSNLGWFGTRDVKAVKSQSDGEREDFAKSTGTQQIATLTYHYSLSPDFTQVRVVVDIALWRPQPSHGASGSAGLTVLSRQRIATITELRKRSYDHAENIAQWSADNGKATRAAIATSFNRLSQLIPFALGLTQTDIKTFQAPHSDSLFAAGFYGPSVKGPSNLPEEKLIWSQGLVDVMPAQISSENSGA